MNAVAPFTGEGPSMPQISRRLAALAAAGAALAGTVAATAEARTSLLYDTQDAVRTIVRPESGVGLGPERGALRQDPGPGGLFTADGTDERYRVGKVSADEIVDLPAEAIAARLRREIDTAEYGAASHLVSIDEIGNRFNDGRARITYRTVTFRGRTLRIGSHMQLVVTRDGWHLKRRAAQAELLPEVRPDSPGARLSAAMRILAGTPSPYGGSYASRVHVYVAPAFSTSIGAGRGTHRNLGNDGKPHRATWRGVMPALALSGGVWLEMYHGAGGSTAFTAREWRTVPTAFAGYLGRFGGSVDRLHFLMSGTPVPAGARGCGSAMSCTWALAEAGAVNRRVMSNGVGAYKVGDQAAEWLAEHNERFPG